jgi:hypothetical protein
MTTSILVGLAIAVVLDRVWPTNPFARAGAASYDWLSTRLRRRA